MKLWKPSNGDDSMYMENICCTCERDRASWSREHGGQDSPEDGCRIIAEMYDKGEHPAWVVDEEGIRCTQFVEEGEPIPPKRCRHTLDMFGGGA